MSSGKRRHEGDRQSDRQGGQVAGFMQALGGSARVEIWNMLTDLMEARLDVERAMQVTIQTFRDQGPVGEGVDTGEVAASLLDGRFPEEVALWVPATEAMVIQATAGWMRAVSSRRLRGSRKDAGSRNRLCGARSGCRRCWRPGS